MDVLTAMVEHHLWLVGEIVDRLDRLDDAVLDQPITLSVEGIDTNPTLRHLADRLVGQMEMWVAAVGGGTVLPRGRVDADGVKQRLAVVGPAFRAAIVEPVRSGRGDETFVDTMCEPPQTFSYGGVLAHVLTFAAVRRTLAIGALDSAGIAELGSGDPQEYVGGTGLDASAIHRNRG